MNITFFESVILYQTCLLIILTQVQHIWSLFLKFIDVTFEILGFV